jgi:PAS domain S-box-containing protein
MSKIKILVVEDESLVAEDIQNTLRGLGYEVMDVLSTGKEALAALRDIEPDLILMDIMLKGEIDGIVTAERIWEAYGIPVIYLTAYADETTLSRAKVTEPFGYILKPFKKRELQTTIEMAFYKAQMDKILREREEWLSTILKSIGDGVIATDIEDRISFMNPLAEHLSGWNQSDVLKRPLAEILPNQPAAPAGPSNGPSPAVENILTAKSGETIPIEQTVTAFIDARKRRLGNVFIFRDITRRKQAESQREAALEEVRRKAKDLQEKNDELIRFTVAVLHDLKSPLITIQTFQGYLGRDIRTQDAARIEKDLGYIGNAADKIGRLIDELHRLSRVGGNINPSEDAPLQAIVQEALDLVAGRITERGVRVDITEEPVMLWGDRMRLVEVFQNLVDNAAKFMGDEPAPRVEVGVEQAGEEMVLYVRDNGIGIDPQVQPMLFGLFQKLDPETEGMGIGLTLVRRIVELHGGRIWVESEGPGKGATFRFTLAKMRCQRPKDMPPVI